MSVVGVSQSCHPYGRTIAGGLSTFRPWSSLPFRCQNESRMARLGIDFSFVSCGWWVGKIYQRDDDHCSDGLRFRRVQTDFQWSCKSFLYSVLAKFLRDIKSLLLVFLQQSTLDNKFSKIVITLINFKCNLILNVDVRVLVTKYFEL